MLPNNLSSIQQTRLHGPCHTSKGLKAVYLKGPYLQMYKQQNKILRAYAL